MRRIREKLRRQAGESIAETLVALLIAALALTMLAGAVVSSVNIIEKSRDKLDAYYDANEDMVKASGATGIVTIKSGAGLPDLSQQDVSIEYGMNDEFGKTPVIAYKKYTAPAGG